MKEMKTLTINEQTYEVVDGNAVHFNEQILTPEEQAQVRDNIGAVTITEVTSLIDEKLPDIINQDMTPEEQAQVRANIDAVSAAEVASLIDERISSITNAEEVAY